MTSTAEDGINVDWPVVVRKMSDLLATQAVELAIARGGVETLVAERAELLNEIARLTPLAVEANDAVPEEEKKDK